MLSCIAIDDEPLALQLLIAFAGRHPELQLLATFQSPVKAKEFLQYNEVDLLFLDVDMHETNGIDFAKALTQKPAIVFTTAYREYAVEGFELDAVDYLLKPFDFERFCRAIEKVIVTHAALVSRKDFFTVYEEYQLVKLFFSDIVYIESMQDYVKIHLHSGKTVITLSTLKGILERLPVDQFVRVHRSFIVSLKYIQSFSNKKIKLPCTEIGVSDSYYHDVLARLKR